MSAAPSRSSQLHLDAAGLDRLAEELVAHARPRASLEAAPVPEPRRDEQIARRIKQHLKARDARAALLPRGWFSDPAWDILLALALGHHEGRPVTVGDACGTAEASQATALRWLHNLERAGVVNRRQDERDLRRAFVSLDAAVLSEVGRWTMRFLPPTG
jgi:DNA-binding MarR family transcriptional regulator